MGSVTARAAALAAVVWALLAGMAAADTVVPDPPLADADYFAFADGVTTAMEHSWGSRGEVYRDGRARIDTISNAAMLTVFATAAAHGHDGPARNDERARSWSRRCTASRRRSHGADARRTPTRCSTRPGWTSNMDGHYVDMDKSIDPKVAEGLQIAWRARDGARPRTPRRAGADRATRSTRSSHGPFFRYPLVRLNQINWNAELYALRLRRSPATRAAARRTTGAHMHRFVAGVRRPWTPGGAHNLGAELPLPLPEQRGRLAHATWTRAEYANITLHFV